MLAKGRLLGIQFETLFTDGLYFQVADHADRLAMKLKTAFLKKGYPLRYDSYTNQQFPILPNSQLEQLKGKYTFGFWEAVDEAHSAVRFCTSWATKEEAVDALIRDIEEMNTLEIGRAGMEDLAKIGQMEAEIFPDAWSEKALAETWEQKTSVMITARKDGELIGYLIVYLVEGEGEIARIAVKQGLRRQGLPVICCWSWKISVKSRKSEGCCWRCGRVIWMQSPFIKIKALPRTACEKHIIRIQKRMRC